MTTARPSRRRRRSSGSVAFGFVGALAFLFAAGLAAPLCQEGVVSAATPARILDDPVPWTDRARSVLGYFAIVGLAVALSRSRRAISWKLVGLGIATHVGFALALFSFGESFFETVNRGFLWVANFTNDGALFVFGSFASEAAGRKVIESPLQNFAFVVLPTIVFFCCLMTVLYHLGIMQLVVKAFAWIMQRTMGTSGAETLSAASNIFLGQTEAPLLVKPFVEKMTRSELMSVMTGGFATIAGSVLALYTLFLKDWIPGIGGHLMAASVLNAPAGLFLSKILLPEEDVPETRGTLRMAVARPDANVVGAAARGASEGVLLAINVAAMLIAFIAMVALVNGLLQLVCGALGFPNVNLERILAWAAYPFAWLMGVRAEDCAFVSTFLGEKLILTELWSYKHLAASLASGGGEVHARSALVATYALLGFANFASIGIQIGGIGGIAPSRRADLAQLGVKAMFAGTLAAYLSGCLAGALR